jgi:hypothetical protein
MFQIPQTGSEACCKEQKQVEKGDNGQGPEVDTEQQVSP